MTPTFSYSSPEKCGRDDIKLAKMFLGQFRDKNGIYVVAERPDLSERKEKAVEAIAVAENGHRLAIEHTYIQPFEGQMADNAPFLTVFEQFRTDSSLRIPNRFVDVLVPALTVPKGIDWKDTAKKVREWFNKEKGSSPDDGEKEYIIPDAGFDLKVVVRAYDLPKTAGVLVTGRIMPKGSPFDEVLRKAIEQEVPKLVATPADSRILLLEDGSTAIGFGKVGRGLDENAKRFPDLQRVDSVWIIHTMGWKSSGDAFFVRVWPVWTGERFWIKDQRFVKTKTSKFETD